MAPSAFLPGTSMYQVPAAGDRFTEEIIGKGGNGEATTLPDPKRRVTKPPADSNNVKWPTSNLPLLIF